MGTQYETVNVVIGGANPQTIPVTIPVDTNLGTGSTTLTYTGTNGGSDTLQGTATIAGSNYTTNSASVNWQQTNGIIQVGSVVTCYAWNDSPTSGPVAGYIWKNASDPSGNTIRTISTASATQTNNSLAFSAYIGGDSGGSGPQWSSFNTAGQQTAYTNFPPYGSNFNCCIVGSILVPAPGTYTFNITYKDGVMWGIGNSATGASPTWAGKGITLAALGQNQTVALGLPILPAAQNSGSGGYVGSSTVAVTFSQAGVYPIEGDWDYWYHSGRVFHITTSSGELAPVTLIAAPAPATPVGNVTITPGGGATNLQVVGQPITLTVNVSGIVYPTKSYCPVLEGTTGKLYLYNDPNNPTFTFPTYNGSPVNKTAAAKAVLALTSTDNTAYQGLFGVNYDGTNFTVNYNGNTANPSSSSRVLSTSLVVQADDIAWFNNASTTFDTFAVSGTNGGVSFNIEVDYMNMPQVASLSPTSIPADGGSYTLSVALNKAFSPQQQGAKNTGNSVNASCTISGATSTGTPSPVLDSAGWLTGWNIPFTAPAATTNQTLTVNMTVNGTLTYLSNDTFVTNTVSYISGQVGTITAAGSSYVAPVAVGMTVTPSLTLIPPTVTSMTLTAQMFTAGGSDPVGVNFFTQYVGQSTQTVIGSSSTPVTSASAIINGVSGYLQTFQLTFNPNTYVNTAPGDYFGFIATDNVSNLTCTYTTTVAYTLSGSGGGGGGCPAVTMFVLPDLKVAEVTVGTHLDAIVHYSEHSLLPVQWMEFSTEICYRLEAENGAAVIVSESTPVPTQEILARTEVPGVGLDDLPAFAGGIQVGMHVLTNVDDVIEWSKVVGIQCVGHQRVARLFIGNENFAAGEKPNARIYTHNISGGLIHIVK